METSFFSGSENLYKYLVTIGILLIVLTVYYPLNEKQSLEILIIQLEKDVKLLNYKINQNAKNLKLCVSQNIKSKNNIKILEDIQKLNNENYYRQLDSERKYSEISIRKGYIKLYNIMFWFFFPIGIYLTIFGFIKWKNAKKFDDNILKLENEKLELEVKKMRETF